MKRRFVARQWTKEDGCGHMIGLWGIFDTKDNDTIFGDNMPRDQREAEQCVRAIELAVWKVTQDMREMLESAIRKI